MLIQKDVFSDDWCDFIFESRNKAYGAYALRKRYPDNIGIAFFITVAVFGFGLCLPTIYRYFSSEIMNSELFENKEVVELVTVKLPEEEVKIPEMKPQRQEPVHNVVANLPPVIVDRTDVQDAVPTDDMFVNATPGTITQAGDDTGIDPGLVDGPVEMAGIETPPGPPPTFVEQMPEYIGGEPAMINYINSKIKYPQISRELGITGTAYVTFVINKEGKVENAVVARGFDRLCNLEALRVIQSMPVWKPGKQNGNVVAVQLTLPVRFHLQ